MNYPLNNITFLELDYDRKVSYILEQELLNLRIGWDSNPRTLDTSIVFKTSALNHSATYPTLRSRRESNPHHPGTGGTDSKSAVLPFNYCSDINLSGKLDLR